MHRGARAARDDVTEHPGQRTQSPIAPPSTLWS
jgi:hypothetical protein